MAHSNKPIRMVILYSGWLRFDIGTQFLASRDTGLSRNVGSRFDIQNFLLKYLALRTEGKHLEDYKRMEHFSEHTQIGDIK